MKKILIKLTIMLLIYGCIGCSSQSSQSIQNTQGTENMQSPNYLLCNDTSMDNMAEMESGFFYVFEELLYYADRENMTNWVPVCNKADCIHNGTSCNAYVGYEIAQKDGKLYYVSSKAYNSTQDIIYVSEISVDGSGSKNIYEIPFEDGAYPITYRALISSHSLILNYIYLTEDGMYQNDIARLNEDGTLYQMHSEITEEQIGHLFLSASGSFVRGKECIISSSLTTKYTDTTGIDVQKILWRMDGDRPEYVKLPEDVSITWGYLSDDYYIDYGNYEEGKGYYKIDVDSGEKTLLGKAKQDNAWGYIMTEDCVVESNRYMNQSPEDAYLRIYYNEKWMDVSLPEVVTKFKNTSFAPLSIASDRIFFMQDVNGAEGYSCRLYYVLLNDKTPELTYCTTFGSDSYFELSNLEQSTQIEDIKEQDLDITVFDTEEYLIQVTGIEIEPVYADEEKTVKLEDLYKITMHCENKTKNQDFKFRLQDGAINGVACYPAAGFSLKAGETKEHIFYINQTWNDLYSFYDFTDIAFLVYESSDFHMQKIVHIYPQGEEQSISHIRESQETDEVLIDNEYIKITIIDYESNHVANDTVTLLIENKSDESIRWIRKKFPYINYVPFTELIQHDGSNYFIQSGTMKTLLPHCCEYVTLQLPSNFLEANNITSIEAWDIEVVFWHGKIWDKVLLEETLTIIPSV